jgi:hypothetical protein
MNVPSVLRLSSRLFAFQGLVVVQMLSWPVAGKAATYGPYVRVTRDLIRAGQLLKIDVLDHVIVGAAGLHCSLRELGFFFA